MMNVQNEHQLFKKVSEKIVWSWTSIVKEFSEKKIAWCWTSIVQKKFQKKIVLS
jgi:hypothetical protein